MRRSGFGLRTRVGLSTMLATLLAAVMGAGCQPGAPKGPGTPSRAVPGPGAVTFQDQAGALGVRYRLAPEGKRPLTIRDISPGGAAIADLDLDGWPDLILVGPPRCAVFRNVRGERFEDVTASMGLTRSGYWMGCAVGDYDGDRYPDVLLTGYHCGALLHNIGGKRFQDRTRDAGLAFNYWSTSGSFADLDNDGWLDLYVGGYVDYRQGHQDRCDMGGILSTCGPELYPAVRGRLYRNLRNGRFQDVTRASGLDRAAGKTWGVAVADYDQDGRADLYLANDQVPGNLFHNLGRMRFEDVGTASGTAYSASGAVHGGMGVDWGDYNDDGRLDLFVTTYARQVKELYRNQGGGLFTPTAQSVGLAGTMMPQVAFGCAFLDADNDGDLDLITASGHIRDNVGAVSPGESYRQPMQFFNNSAGEFRDASASAGAPFADPMVGRGLAVGDLNGDGRTDVVVVDREGPARVLINGGNGGAAHWLKVSLEGPAGSEGPAGAAGNRHGIGALVSLTAGGRRQWRLLTAGRSLLSSSEPAVQFGLGATSDAERIEVLWPDGLREEWASPQSDRLIRLRRGSGSVIRGNAGP